MEFDELLITTGVDALVRLVKEKNRIELEEASAVLNIPPESLEDWSRVLEEEGIIKIEYRLTKIYLLWIKPTESEIATEKQSFYEEKEDIQKQVDSFKKNLSLEKIEIEDLKTGFEQFYSKTFSKIEELEKKVSPLPASELLTQGNLINGESELNSMKDEFFNLKSGLKELEKEIDSVAIVSNESEEKIKKLDGIKNELHGHVEEMQDIKRRLMDIGNSDDVNLPSINEIKKKLETINKDYKLLKSRNASLHEDMISLHESSEILKDVAESMIGQEEKIQQMKTDIKEVAIEAQAIFDKVKEVNSGVQKQVEMVGRIDDSITVAKGVIGRFPNEDKIVEEIEKIKGLEKALESKYDSIQKLVEAVGGKQLSSKQYDEVSQKIDEKIRQASKDIDALESALEDEKNTYLTFQKIKERIVPSIDGYKAKMEEMQKRIDEIGKEAIAQKENIRKDAAKLEETLKGGEYKNIIKIAEEIRDKKKVLEEVKKQIYDLSDLSDNLSKRVNLLSREAKLLQIRAGGGTDTTEERKAIENKLELSKEEELEFKRKRDELKKLIKRLWEE